jgi:hypothetical protein
VSGKQSGSQGIDINGVGINVMLPQVGTKGGATLDATQSQSDGTGRQILQKNVTLTYNEGRGSDRHQLSGVFPCDAECTTTDRRKQLGIRPSHRRRV